MFLLFSCKVVFLRRLEELDRRFFVSLSRRRVTFLADFWGYYSSRMGKLKSDLLVKCGVVISFTDLLASSELLSLQNSGYTSLFYKKISFQWAYLQSQNDSLALCSTPVVLIAETYPPYFYSCFHVSLDPIVNLRWRFNSGGYCAWLIFLVAGVKGMNFLYGSFWD